MSQLRAAGAVAAALGALAAVTAACGTDGHPGPPSGAAGATASGKGGASGEPPFLSLGGSSHSSAGSGVTMDPVVECAGVLVEAKSTPFDMYVMLDISASMLLRTEGNPLQSKWQAVRSALSAFVSDDASAGIGVGLQVFPLPDPAIPDECTADAQCRGFRCLTQACWPPQNGLLYVCAQDSECESGDCVDWGLCANDQTRGCNLEEGPSCTMGRGACEVQTRGLCEVTADCRPARYAEPAAPIAELPAAQAGLLAVLNGVEPDGYTPTGPALQGALDQASSWAQAHPDHQVVAVLATDGLPTLEQDGMACRPSAMPEDQAVIDIATAGLAATPSIATFVIGVFGALEPEGPPTVHAIAEAGGTDQAFIVDTAGDVSVQFRQALNAIRASRLSCELLVPESETGEKLDYMTVNVLLDDGSGSDPKPILYVSNAAGCRDNQLNWYYDADPEPPVSGTPTRIVACPATCAAFHQVETGSVAIKLGCATKTQVVK